MRDSISGGALTETTFLILLALYTPNHGYGIMQFIEKQTEGRILLGAGTLYGAINTLLKKEWIMLYDKNNDPRKKQYILTVDGKEIINLELKRLKQVWDIANNIIGGKDNEEKKI